MNIIYIILALIGALAIGFIGWLWYLSIPKKMSLDEMKVRVRSLRKTYWSFSELERNTQLGKTVFKSIMYLERKISEAEKLEFNERLSDVK
ncbi:hypothetical protein TH53_19740 [Pedobacter lusitanus]|uniref:Uncharacterized protein n=1 Tax=Pedobacter lusitanus TaxID=1503925 RepID=A0A0D0F1R8_9SPHI|nr:hypothetical protein [Pedobacter lusitanus]KIO75573.1 hypothetical protein TH53_19740 [Pedobacter lusitanus]